jgi:hypothetical protein
VFCVCPDLAAGGLYVETPSRIAADDQDGIKYHCLITEWDANQVAVHYIVGTAVILMSCLAIGWIISVAQASIESFHQLATMGVTIHYRGSLADLVRVEDFEDRVIDLALALGSECRVWRSADSDPNRLVRGVILDLAPGQESTSLLISPEGWLIGLIEIEAAEKGELTEKPWCFVKTQFGSVEGHVALVELLRALKAEFMPNLEVSDEGEYWERRDVGILQQRMAFLSGAIDALGRALENSQLSAEAAEDPEIVATRVERIAHLVQQTLARPAEHPPTRFPEGEESWQFDVGENEAFWDELYRENRRKQEQITRIIEERMAQGLDAETAYETALDQVLGLSLEDDGEEEGFAHVVDVEYDNAETIKTDEEFLFEEAERHPLLQRATEFLKGIYKIVERGKDRSAALGLALRGAMETNGGLVQALSGTAEWFDDLDATGLSIAQLKRALRGGAFVVGSLYQLRVEKTITDHEFTIFKEEIDAIQTEIVGLLKELRGKC